MAARLPYLRSLKSKPDVVIACTCVKLYSPRVTTASLHIIINTVQRYAPIHLVTLWDDQFDVIVLRNCCT